nr:uncharacterized protein LOC111390246 [Ipomoea batatas]
MKKWVTLLHYNMVDQLHTTRYFLKEEVNGEQQHNPKRFLGQFSGTIVMLIWMLRNKMPLMCSWGISCRTMVNQHYGNWIMISIIMLEGTV